MTALTETVMQLTIKWSPPTFWQNPKKKKTCRGGGGAWCWVSTSSSSSCQVFDNVRWSSASISLSLVYIILNPFFCRGKCQIAVFFFFFFFEIKVLTNEKCLLFWTQQKLCIFYEGGSVGISTFIARCDIQYIAVIWSYRIYFSF